MANMFNARLRVRLLGASLFCWTVPLSAQPAPPADGPEPVAEEEIVVTAGRALRGAVPGDVQPVIQLNPADIRSYGVNTLTDLIAELGPQTRSTRGGPPVILLEGQRISGFQEIRDLPVEAIARVDVLPEEAALRFGFGAGQRVVNIVLVQRFRAWNAELEGGGTTDGGGRTGEVEAGYLRIRNGGRLNIEAEASGTGGLTEADRGIIPPASAAGQAAFRSLTPDTQSYSLNSVYAKRLGDVGMTLNGRIQQDYSDRMLGLNGADLLMQGVNTLTAHAGVTLNGNLKTWRWSLTGNYDRVDARTATDTIPGLARAQGVSDQGQFDVLLNGALFALPAGDVSLSLQGGGSFNRFESDTQTPLVSRNVTLTRNIASGQASIDLPIASVKNDVLAFLGNLSVNANVAYRDLSDFGGIRTLGGGVNWRPAESLRLLVNYTDDELAPTVQQLGNPVIFTPNTPVFDPVTGQTVLVTQITGGNPGLDSSRNRSWKVSANWQPIKDTDLTLSADYLRTRNSNPLQAFPVGVAALAAAFPERFERDVDGDLVSADVRPINFFSAAQDQLRWGVNFSKSLATKLPKPPEGWMPPWVRAAIADARARGIAIPDRLPGTGGPPPGMGGPPGGGRPGGSGGFGRGGMFGGGGGGRLNLSLYHSWTFSNDVVARPGFPVIDLLSGGSITGLGGQPRHALEAQLGWFRDGWGLRASANWQSATRVDGVAGVPTSQLNFGDIGTLNLRLFYSPQSDWRLMDAHPWLRGTRISLNVTNLFNARQRVTDGTGANPLAFQPAYLDAAGRRIVLSVRKLFIPQFRIPANFVPPTAPPRSPS